MPTQEVSLQSVVTQDGEVGPDVRMEGYLYKRTSNAFKTWVRRWFMIQNNQLVYRKRSGKEQFTVMEDDLRLCTVKPALEIDKRFCFEIISPGRTHMLQADFENECQAWIGAIQAGVTKAYRDAPAIDEEDIAVPNSSYAANSTTPIPGSKPAKKAVSKQRSRMDQIINIPGNEACADCGSPDPRWASINLGITLCIECSGIHRSFGVHMSKVRSVTLDAWEPELLKVMAELGNTAVNRVYEANVDESQVVRATPHCNRTVREQWIRSKYIDKVHIRRLPKVDGPGTDTIKRWSVYRRKRRSPDKSKDELPPPSENDTAIGATGADADTGTTAKCEARGGTGAEMAAGADGSSAKMVQGESQDSGLGGSTPDVIVFGVHMQIDPNNSTDHDADSESSTSEPEADQDTRSTTSFEELTKLGPDLLLYRAAQARNLPVMLEALAQGANPNWHHMEEHGKTPLVMAIESGSMAPCELLLLNGAKVDQKDDMGRTPLHHATTLGHTGQVCQFLKRNANQHAVDANGKDPLSIAMGAENADIVTLLRLAKLNEEMKETEGMYAGPGDETFTEVFRDFTNMANNTPEKLNRHK